MDLLYKNFAVCYQQRRHNALLLICYTIESINYYETTKYCLPFFMKWLMMSPSPSANKKLTKTFKIRQRQAISFIIIIIFKHVDEQFVFTLFWQYCTSFHIFLLKKYNNTNISRLIITEYNASICFQKFSQFL